MMIELLSLSESIAKEAHEGQLYGGRDYFNAHITPVVRFVCRLGYGPEYQATAFLHDVKEDKGITERQLMQRGVPVGIARSVGILSKDPETPHSIYMTKIADDDKAIVAKFADSSVNYVNTLLTTEGSSHRKFIKRVHEYAGNIAFLHPLLPPVDSLGTK